VELSLRSGNGREVAIITNLSTTSQTITLPAPMKDLLHEGAKVTSINLARYGVAVLGEK